MADKKKQLVFNIIDFIRTSAEDGSVKEADKESLEVAVQCLAEAFELDPDSTEEKEKYSIAPATLPSLLDVFLRTKSKSSATAPTSSSSTTTPPTTTSAPSSSNPTAEQRAQAESLKSAGNALMSRRPSPDYAGAIEKYTSAIALDATNPVYWSNRAAAHGAQGSHELAITDAEEATRLDPSFSKGWSRLGHAYYSLGEYQDSISAYKKGLEVDPTNKNMLEAIKQARIKLKELGEKEEGVEEDEEEVPAIRGGAGAGRGAGGMPDLSALAGLMGGAGGGGAGGMPDLASLMQNPALMQMAQQMMSNGGLDSLMQNPMMRNMAERMQSGGGMPDLNALASDPEMRNLAQQYMGRGGAGADGAGGAGGN